MKKIIIADLDGTIALIDHRRHFVTGGHSDWDAFYAAVSDDQPHVAVIAALQVLHLAGHPVHIVSGRDDITRPQTIAWLKKHGVPYDSLVMRAHGDYTPDDVLKDSWFYDSDLDDVLMVFDDRQKVVDMWRARGLTVFQVAPGDF